MAQSLAIPKATCHVRSISLPSRSHPLTLSIEDHLYRLRASESTSSSSASSICHNLGSLKGLYDCVDDLLQLPLTQQALSHEQHAKWAEEVLDGSLRLLDVFATAGDVLLHMKESIQELESSLRRRRGGESGVANEVGAFMISRKKVKKMVSKCIGNLKRMDKNCTSPLLDKDSNLVAVVSVLREVEAIGLSTMKSLFSFVSGTKAGSKHSSWSLVSRLMQPKRVSSETEEGADINEVERIDGILSTLNFQRQAKTSKLYKMC
ncbi:hypothetical protein L1049_026165 [Liquidambar formosana]|uniref:DUF241 domain protein n=1 Tax=Liquidambar formosana TaxID=63359 RepID=A0AAP0R723_LIQFO